MAKELKDMEDVQDQHCKEMAALRKKVSGVFKVNRALLCIMQRTFELRSSDVSFNLD